MAFIDGISNTHNSIQFHKLVTEIGVRNNPVLAAVARNGIKGTDKDTVKWSAYDFGTIGNTSRSNLEGQDAPDGKVFTPDNFENSYTIVHESWGITYSQATMSQDEATSAANLAMQEQGILQFASNQMARKLMFNTRHVPANINEAPENDGLVPVIKSAGNVLNLNGAELTVDDINRILQTMFEAGSLSGNVVAVMSATMKQKWNKILKGSRDFVDYEKKMANIVVDSVETDFGILHTMIDLNMNNVNYAGAGDSIVLLDLDKIFLNFKEIVRFNETTGKAYGGYLFSEPLAKTGSSQKYQLYGEFTVEYAHPRNHAIITNVGAVTTL